MSFRTDLISLSSRSDDSEFGDGLGDGARGSESRCVLSLRSERFSLSSLPLAEGIFEDDLTFFPPFFQ